MASILVVDDEPTIRALVAKIVERIGYKADLARDGADAIAKLEKQHYSVLIVDLMMPVMDGYGVVDWVKQNANPKPAIIVVSAADSAALRRFDGSVVHSIIRKPFDVDVLSDLITAAIKSTGEEEERGGEVIPFRNVC
ncbi:MAG TPA: response regulator [Thermoanaerobaculia bacterium]|nr:response regulator [Thermoanaerobaculia bacterium]